MKTVNFLRRFTKPQLVNDYIVECKRLGLDSLVTETCLMLSKLVEVEDSQSVLYYDLEEVDEWKFNDILDESTYMPNIQNHKSDSFEFNFKSEPEVTIGFFINLENGNKVMMIDFSKVKEELSYVIRNFK